MLFITNRHPKGSQRTRKGRTFAFDLANNAPSHSAFFCERADDGSCTEIGGFELMQRLKDHPARQILLFIHGFSNLPEDVFDAAREMQRMADEIQDGEVLVLPAIWPCDNDAGIVKDYWDDQKAADMSAMSFARMLEIFMGWRADATRNPEDAPCMKRINVLAHSMGNRVLREAIWTWSRYDLADGPPLLFRNTFMAAADVVNESLEPGQRGETICHASRNVVCYYASDDVALRASKVANVRNKVASRRLGHTGPEDLDACPKNVYAVDCDEFNMAYDLKGHSYYRSNPSGEPGALFRHMMASIIVGRPVALGDAPSGTVAGQPVPLGDGDRRLFLDDPTV